jgi:hypothetical protein
MAPFHSQEPTHLTRQCKSTKQGHDEAALLLSKTRLEALHHCIKTEAGSGEQMDHPVEIVEALGLTPNV